MREDPDFCATVGDIQAKPTRVSGGIDFPVMSVSILYGTLID